MTQMQHRDTDNNIAILNIPPPLRVRLHMHGTTVMVIMVNMMIESFPRNFPLLTTKGKGRTGTYHVSNALTRQGELRIQIQLFVVFISSKSMVVGTSFAGSQRINKDSGATIQRWFSASSTHQTDAMSWCGFQIPSTLTRHDCIKVPTHNKYISVP